MGKTRDVFKKIRDTKGTFHAKMGTIKDRNGMEPNSKSAGMLILGQYLSQPRDSDCKTFSR